LHAQTGLRVILDLRGLFVKIGQVSLLTLIWRHQWRTFHIRYVQQLSSWR
jgi:hypothetical protein